ncbi:MULTISPECIES: hypothetical protein [unclassified Bordetella]|uniref:hypothetical protein n=1 Tax=unclassified Bordetella TaxID=2630031 RepID=UPI00132157A3|nr:MULTISPECIES: hypothetical protein [unclassified Bordetella]MVW72581.1 hypothetical protein [Bordetella sp. 15P40C-2]MVW78507.1 hypothetical protein [Bordetella sp. 02P26C-1]
MRELTRQQLQSVHGAQRISELLPDDIIPVSVATGYSVGTFVKSLATSTYNGSATDLAVALSDCHNRLRTFRSVIGYVYELPVGSKPLDMVSFFVCGTIMGLAVTNKKG